MVKFQNNPQHLRVLANELIATRLAEAVGLTVPATDVVEVSAWLIAQHARHARRARRAAARALTAGLQFGSRFIGGLMPGQVVDYLPEPQLDEVRNLAEFAGMLALDKWTGNATGARRSSIAGRASAATAPRSSTRASASTPATGTFPTRPCAACTRATACYAGVTGWASFEPWLTPHRGDGRRQHLEHRRHGSAGVVRAATCRASSGCCEQLLRRRGRVRELIAAFRDSNREPFPLWDKKPGVAVPPQFVEGAAGKFVM